MKKRFLSLFLALSMLMSLSLNSVAYAKENEAAAIISKGQKSVKEVASEIEKALPSGSKIIISDMGEINVFVSADLEGNSEISLATTGSTYAPNGGSYRSFQPQWYSQVQPYSIVFLPAAQAKAFVYARNNSNLFNDVISWAGTYAVEQIAAKILAKYGISIPAVGISFLIFVGSYAVLQKYDASMAFSAYNKSAENKICIQRVTNQGFPVNYYFPWTGYCTPSPYGAWNPIFYPSKYDI